jgi:hypothetical protein
VRASDMFPEDIPLLNTPSLVALVLRAADEGGASAESCADRLEALFRRTEERPPVDRDELITRCGRTLGWLREAGLLEAGDERWVLTARGREALAAHPQGMDLADLAAYPEFAAYLARRERGTRRDPRSNGYGEGFAARQAGRAFTDNPYGFGSADHLAWENGWCEALDEEEGPGLSPVTGGRRDAN